MSKVGEFLTYLKVERGYSDRTIDGYGRDLLGFEEFCADTDAEISALTADRDIVRRWVMHLMERGNKPTSVNRRLSALRSYYKYLMLMGEAVANPVYGVKGPKKNKPLPVFVKVGEMDRLFDNVEFPPGYTGLLDRTILLTFYLTGMRLAELIGLDVDDVDFASGRIRVTGKRNKQRILPFVGELADALANLVAARAKVASYGEKALFVMPVGARVSRYYVHRVVRMYLTAVTTVSKRSPHVLRHTFATAMLNGDAGLEVVKEMLGHESIATTEVYTHTTFDELSKNYKKAHPRGEPDTLLK